MASQQRGTSVLHPFIREYCGWLEQLAEAQRHCEAVAESVLQVEEQGRPLSAELNARYVEAHQALGRVAERFPGQPV